MGNVYILGGLRSYIGVENGMYKNIPAEEIGAEVLKKTIQRAGVKESDINLVIAGNAVGAGGNIARLMTLTAGLSEEIPAFTVDMQCGSGLESIAIAASKIKSGFADLIVAGGFESSSTAPRRAYNKNHPDYEKYGGEAGWYKVAKFVPDSHEQTAMLEGAERTALFNDITRQDLNKWVLKSHEAAKKARESGVLKDIVTTVKACAAKDEGIRERMTERFLDRLPCVLKDGEVITVANACLTNDGAAFVVLCSEEYLKKNNLKAEAEFIDICEIGSSPSKSPESVIKAIDRLLCKNNLTPEDIDIYECNEAFAVIDELFARKYPKQVKDYNIFGGALAYGHPYGASGAMIMLHAIKALEHRDGKLALCGIAAAGGVGSAVLIRKTGK